MSEIVKNELDTIKEFAEATEKRGSTLTLNELNYISDKQLHKKDGGGTGGGALILHSDYDTGALDKTWQEIADAFDNGSIIVIDNNSEEDGRSRAYLVGITNGHDVYDVLLRDFSDNVEVVYETNSASGYPTYIE